MVREFLTTNNVDIFHERLQIKTNSPFLLTNIFRVERGVNEVVDGIGHIDTEVDK